MNLVIELVHQPIGQVENCLVLPVTALQARMLEKLLGDSSLRTATIRVERSRTPEGRRTGLPPGFLSASVLASEARSGKERRGPAGRQRAK